MYILYDCLQSGAVFFRAALEEASINYRRVNIDLRKQENLTEEYAKVNPRQQVAALQLNDGSIMTEGVAIMMHIADCHPESNLMPTVASSERAQAMRWLFFFATNVYEGENRMVHPEWYTSEPDCTNAVNQSAVEYVNRHFLLFEEILTGGPYLLGEHLSLVDIYVWMLIQWHRDLNWLETNCPKILKLVGAVMSRPKIEPVHLENFGPGIGLGLGLTTV
jgi:glutathione S-transferase